MCIRDRPIIRQLTGTRTVGGQTGVVLSSTDPDDGESVLIETSAGILQAPGAGADPLTQALGPFLLIKSPVRIGESFRAGQGSLGPVADFDGDGKPDAVTVEVNTQVIGLENVTAAAGTFSQALHQRMTATLVVQSTLTGRAVTLTSLSDDWYAPSIGLVRSQTRIEGPPAGQDTLKTLQGYKVNGQLSDSTAPTASAEGLAGPGVLGPLSRVTVKFSEAMDTRTLTGALQVLDAGGAPVTGTLSVSATGLQFTPATAWRSGSYTAVLSRAPLDLLGNALATEQRWPFTIDATAPSLVQSTPGNQAVDVSTTQPLQLKFSEPVDPASVSSSTLYLTGTTSVPLSFQVEGTVVTATPQRALARGGAYALVIDGVRDLAGNALSATQVEFAADPGRFGAAVALPTLQPRQGQINATTLGDLNGDGRTDIVTTWAQFDNLNGQWTSSIQLHLQQADGQLQPGPIVQLPGGREVRALRVADLEGSGSRQVLAATSTGQVMVFGRDALGQWVNKPSIPSTVSQLIEVADLNRDGRPDLVSVGGDGIVEVWLNLPGGWQLQDRRQLANAGYTVGDLVVGDLNGDGRPDIALSGTPLSDAAAAAALLLQGADGHFSAMPQWLGSGQRDDGRGMAIGDFNGDGRNDLAVILGANGLVLFHQQADSALPSTPSARLATGEVGGFQLKAVDLNQDGRPDLVYDEGFNLVVRLGQAGGGFSEPALYPHKEWHFQRGSAALALGDVNGDGLPDAVAEGDVMLQRRVPAQAEAVRPTPLAGSAGRLAKIRQHLQALAGVR